MLQLLFGINTILLNVQFIKESWKKTYKNLAQKYEVAKTNFSINHKKHYW